MLFNSLEYLLFLPVVAALYFALPGRARWALLLAASYLFYAWWRVEYLLLILGSTAVAYWAGLQLPGAPAGPRRKGVLAVGITALVAALFGFKYFNFFNGALGDLCGWLGVGYDVPALQVLLPVGISFYTFQTLGYLVDVYRGDKEPERHPGVFALYVAFFPQLVAGPIERSTRLMPQLRRHFAFDYDRVAGGLSLVLWGLFKKLVIADRLAAYVDAVYADPGAFSAAPVAVATYFFTFQIYCDFSGYSDIAIGSARIFGVELMENFNRPYHSRSVSEFWKRWHISLSSWFRDYLYIPLGGSRTARGRWWANLMIVFLVSGLWHGANWTFLAWGALHGAYLLASIWTAPVRERAATALGLGRFPRLHGLARAAVVFHLVVFAWIFFRAGSLGDAGIVVQRLVSGGYQLGEIPISGFGWYQISLAVLMIGLMEGVQLLQRRRTVQELFTDLELPARWALFAALIVAIVLFGQFDVTEFIYFQF